MLDKIRAKILIEGVVQGVGFRPFVYRVAKETQLCGYILNSTSGVIIEVEGKKDKIDTFFSKIVNSFPPLAKISQKRIEFYQELVGFSKFEIRESKSSQKEGQLLISPDICVCDACLEEFFNSNDRRYLYPFINCTNCGPRFTIIEALPYDRERTTMKEFEMCPQCKSEYENIENRRFHAQPNACPQCGPQLWLEDGDKPIGEIKEAINLLKSGEILAIKGLGGFHLACDATQEAPCRRLRDKKGRDYKPFAIMSYDISRIKEFCYLSEKEEELLLLPSRPIVLLSKKKEILAESIAPHLNSLGVMLPYSPLHYLLVQPFLALVMTSGNYSDKPLIIDNARVKRELKNITPFSLFHNRKIKNRCDDSVAFVVDSVPVIIRRARGYSPLPIPLKFNLPPVLGLGAELKITFCFIEKNFAFLSPHIGDLKNYDVFTYYRETLDNFCKLFKFPKPEVIVSDLHPDYISTSLAEDYAKSENIKLLKVQHHHAHIASCMAEHNLDNPVIGIAMDGAGFGEEESIWGGEFMVVDYKYYRRLGHLRELPLPGGDKAVKEPWRIAAALLSSCKRIIPKEKISLYSRYKEKIDIIEELVAKGINTFFTSSAGRLFDCIAAILGIREEVDYEGQAAMELEALASCYQASKKEEKYLFNIKGEENFYIDTLPIIEQIIEDIDKGRPKEEIAYRFHFTMSQIIKEAAEKIREKERLDKVCLSGGVFQNRLLLSLSLKELRERGFEVFFNSSVPPNDGGISLGQAVIGGMKLKAGCV
jgi:hydrogenase maturation protein HypF